MRSHDRRILIVASTYPANSEDGRPAFVQDVARSLSSEFEVVVLAPRVRGEVQSTEGVKVVRFPYFPRRWEGLADEAILPELRRSRRRWLEVPPFMAAMVVYTVVLAIRFRPSCINAHWIVPGGLAAFVASRITGVPYAVTIHGADAHALRNGLSMRMKRLVLRNAAAALPVSAHALTRLRYDYGDDLPDKVLVVPMGVQAPNDVRHHDLQTDRSHVRESFLFVGRIAEKKGLSVLIAAMARLKTATLRVVGDGPCRVEAELACEELGVASRVSFLGTLPRSAVLREMARCRALVVPSQVASDGDEDGVPLVVAEALSLGTPVVAASAGGIPEHIRAGDNGFTFDPGDVNGLVSVLDGLSRDPKAAREIGDRGLAYFLESALNLENTKRSYELVLKQLADA